MVQFQPWAKSVVWHGKNGVDSDGNGTLDAREVKAARKRGINVCEGMDEKSFERTRKLYECAGVHLAGIKHNPDRAIDEKTENNIIRIGEILASDGKTKKLTPQKKNALLQQLLCDSSRVLGSVEKSAENNLSNRNAKNNDELKVQTAGYDGKNLADIVSRLFERIKGHINIYKEN